MGSAWSRPSHRQSAACIRWSRFAIPWRAARCGPAARHERRADAGVEGEAVARAMEARGVLYKSRSEAVVERQHVVILRLAPPQLDHILEPPRLLCREIVGLGEIAVEMEQLPSIVFEWRTGRM